MGLTRRSSAPETGQKPGEPLRRLTDLADDGDRPLTTHELARMIGMSSTFVRSEIHSGQLRAITVGRGRRRVFRIPVKEALDYISKLGLRSS
jgi:excisionase family DNA binding protein